MLDDIGANLFYRQLTVVDAVVTHAHGLRCVRDKIAQDGNLWQISHDAQGVLLAGHALPLPQSGVRG